MWFGVLFGGLIVLLRFFGFLILIIYLVVDACAGLFDCWILLCLLLVDMWLKVGLLVVYLFDFWFGVLLGWIVVCCLWMLVSICFYYVLVVWVLWLCDVWFYYVMIVLVFLLCVFVIWFVYVRHLRLADWLVVALMNCFCLTGLHFRFLIYCLTLDLVGCDCVCVYWCWLVGYVVIVCFKVWFVVLGCG